jgi:hypothetical protein
MRTLVLALAAAAPLLVSTTFTAAAQPAAHQPPARCFRSQDWEGWKATPDGRTLYLRVLMHDFYRVDLAGACPELNAPDAHLVTHVRGSDEICAPVDLDLRVSTGMGFATPCIVRSITPLTAEEAKALPPKLRP